MPYVIITEGSHTIGMGHVVRMLYLARRLLRHGEVLFLSRSDEKVRRYITDSGFQCLYPHHGYCETLEQLSAIPTIVIDTPDVSLKMTRDLKNKTTARIVLFAVSVNIGKYADVVVNALFETNLMNRIWSKDNTTYLLGPRYIIPTFDEMVEIPQGDDSGESKKYLLAFGGSDPTGLTSFFLRKFLENDKAPMELNILIGRKNQDEVTIRSLALQLPPSTVTYVIMDASRNDLFNMMKYSDAILTSPGNTLFEAFSMRKKTAAFFQNKKQREIFKFFPNCYNYTLANSTTDFLSLLDRLLFVDYQGIERLQISAGIEEIVSRIVDE